MLPWEQFFHTGKCDLLEALSKLEGLVAKDFQGDLSVTIHTIYQTTHVMFGDMPPCDQMRAKPGVIYPLLTDYHLFTMRPLVPAAKLRQVR